VATRMIHLAGVKVMENMSLGAPDDMASLSAIRFFLAASRQVEDEPVNFSNKSHLQSAISTCDQCTRSTTTGRIPTGTPLSRTTLVITTTDMDNKPCPRHLPNRGAAGRHHSYRVSSLPIRHHMERIFLKFLVYMFQGKFFLKGEDIGIMETRCTEARN